MFHLYSGGPIRLYCLTKSGTPVYVFKQWLYNPVMQSSEKFWSLSNIWLWLKHWKLFFILDPRALWAFRILLSRKRPRKTRPMPSCNSKTRDGIYLLLSYCSGPNTSFNNPFCWKLLYYFSLLLDSFLMLPIKALKRDYMSYSVRNAPAQALHPKAAVGGSYRSQKQQQPPDSSSLEALICPIPSFLLSYTYGKEPSCNCYLCYFSYFCFSCLLSLLEPIPVSNFHDWNSRYELFYWQNPNWSTMPRWNKSQQDLDYFRKQIHTQKYWLALL